MREMVWQGLAPDVVSYSAAISACEKGTMPEMALDLLKEMEHKGLEPDVITYTVAISACEKGKMPEKVLDLLKEMEQRGLEPNVMSRRRKGGGIRTSRQPEEKREHWLQKRIEEEARRTRCLPEGGRRRRLPPRA